MSLISLRRCPVCGDRGHHPQCEPDYYAQPCVVLETVKPVESPPSSTVPLLTMLDGLKALLWETNPEWVLHQELMAVLRECSLTPEQSQRIDKALTKYHSWALTPKHAMKKG